CRSWFHAIAAAIDGVNLRKVRAGSAFASLMLFKHRGKSKAARREYRPVLPFLIRFNRCCD
ncbi:hypothetical protein, partial [Paenibacillus sp. NPDC058174]|uniref:hypothetical protein n=1 Tax=Paenibacillus sp. NPDC058174 TaxID=3346366 RepID=UPI0036DAEB89